MHQNRHRIRAERWQGAVAEQLADIERLRAKLAQAENDLDRYLANPDEPERRKIFDEFMASGGRRADQWSRWIKKTWPNQRRDIAIDIDSKILPFAPR